MFSGCLEKEVNILTGHIVTVGFAEALVPTLKENEKCNYSVSKAAITLTAQSLLSPFQLA